MLVRPRRVDEPAGGEGTQLPCLRESAHTRTRRGPMWLLSLRPRSKYAAPRRKQAPRRPEQQPMLTAWGETGEPARRAYSRGKREGALGAARFKQGARRQSVTSGCVPRRQLNACLVGEPCATHTYTRRHTTRASESRHAVLTNDAAARGCELLLQAKREGVNEGRRPKAEGQDAQPEGIDYITVNS